MFLTFVSTSVHVLLEVHYVTIQIRPVLYMLLTNLGFIRKGYVQRIKMNYKMYKYDFLNTQYYTSYSIEYYFTYDTVCKLLIAYFANYSNSLYSKINKGIRWQIVEDIYTSIICDILIMEHSTLLITTSVVVCAYLFM